MARRRATDSTGARSLWPLPGPVDQYMQTLATCVEMAHDLPLLEEYTMRFLDRFPSIRRASTARSYLHTTMISLGVLEVISNVVRPTNAGMEYIDVHGGDVGVLRRQLFKVSGIPELLGELEMKAQPIGELLPRMNEYGFGWETDWQLRYRLNWLKAAGVVRRLSEKESRGRYQEWDLIFPHSEWASSIEASN